MNTSHCQTAGNVCWDIAPGWEDLLIGPQGLRLDEWLRDGRAQVVKDGSHRTVYRVDLPDRTLFLKHYRCQPWTAAVRHLLRASASRREWRKTWEVARRQIPTAVPVALGEARRGMVLDNFFVSQGIPGAQSLDDYASQVNVANAASVGRCRTLLTAVARLAAAAHRAGVYHNDFHTGNILIADGEPWPRLYLIDLPGVRLSGSLGWRRSRDSLVMLGSGWLGRLSRTDRHRFWKSYLAERPDLRLADTAAAAREIDERTHAFARRIVRGRDKRALRTNRDFYRLARPSGIAHAVSGLDRQQLVELTEDPQRLFRSFRHEPVKISHSSLVVEAELLVGGVPTRVAYKRSRVKTWWKRWLGLFRRSRAITGWHAGHALLQRGIATARPLAVFQPRPSLTQQDSYLATAWIPGALNLHLYLWRLAACTPCERDRRTRQTAESLGRLLGRMHAWRVSHDDLKACNLVAVEGTDRVETFLIDLDGVQFGRRLSATRRARDLARLATSIEAHGWLTRSVRLRFLQAYLAELGDRQVDWKKTWREIAVRAAATIQQMRRRGRPLA